mgnify:CR=1 FL=1
MKLDLSNLNDAAPLIADLIDTAEDKFATGPERHRWVTGEVAKAMPRYVPAPVKRAIAAWLVEAFFQFFWKQAGDLADRIRAKKAARAAKASAPVVTPSPETVDQELKKIGRKRRTRRAKPSES